MPKTAEQKNAREKAVIRYGAGDLYGFDLTLLSPERIRMLANAPFKSQSCPFRGSESPCNKNDGVCTLRQFSKTGDKVEPVRNASLVATCPNRFYDNDTTLAWVGEVLLGTDTPIVLTELPFLMSTKGDKDNDPVAVGKIDMVLVHPEITALQWCALEIQAVYSSGASMPKDFTVMKDWQGPGLPFPQGIRRPDFRSSDPKCLMPQLQIKVPTISRWGRKVAVVVDQPFWDSLGNISEVDHVSNCEIAWCN